jgi:CRP-like cAMP-binding protein
VTDIADFRATELFAGLGDAALKAAVAGLEGVPMAPRDEFGFDDPQVACCLVGGGRLALSVLLGDQGERTIGMLERGDLVVRPLDGLIAPDPRVRCFAIEASELHLVDRGRMEAWLSDPILAANMVRVLSAQIADRELAVAIALEPRVERRLLLKLRQLAERWGRVTPDGIRLDLRLTHQELANMIGAVRESVTIALGRLADSGEIEMRRRHLIIHPPRQGDRD